MEDEVTFSLVESVKTIIGNLTTAVPIADIVLVIGAIIAAIAVPTFLWKFGRKGFAAVRDEGFAAVRDALSGKKTNV